ncbi:hypothetical protein GTO27_00230, partial [Candidatus Bathyarchaeota archaeon]|nr:hypothetical protein [Candidatus Bathyarchaeota archaeon]
MKFIWRRLIAAIILGVAAMVLGTLIHELGHVIFVVALGGQITEIRISLFSGYCGWKGLDLASDSIATAGGIILTLPLGLILLILLNRHEPRLPFLFRFFVFTLLSAMLLSNFAYLVVHPVQFLGSELPKITSDTITLMERGILPPIFLAMGFLLTWLT